MGLYAAKFHVVPTVNLIRGGGGGGGGGGTRSVRTWYNLHSIGIWYTMIYKKYAELVD